MLVLVFEGNVLLQSLYVLYMQQLFKAQILGLQKPKLQAWNKAEALHKGLKQQPSDQQKKCVYVLTFGIPQKQTRSLCSYITQHK